MHKAGQRGEGKGGPKCNFVRLKGSGRPRVRGSLLGGNGYDEYRFSSMMWAVNHWILSDDNEKLTWMVNDIIAEN